jgi:hypothetical protein
MIFVCSIGYLPNNARPLAHGGVLWSQHMREVTLYNHLPKGKIRVAHNTTRFFSMFKQPSTP